MKQVAYVINAYKSGELESVPRTASMSRRGGAMLEGLTLVVGVTAATLAMFGIIEICRRWVWRYVKKLFKLVAIVVFSNPFELFEVVIIYIIGLLKEWQHLLPKKRENKKELHKQARPHYATRLGII